MEPTQSDGNLLFFGDNLHILREHISSESVDLIYLDPPFNSSATYNILFDEKTGEKSTAQIEAFEDTWHWGQESEENYYYVVRQASKLSSLLQAFRASLGQSDMMAYLAMMASRLQEFHRVLKPTGKIFLHCDPTASHYLKLLMDAVFGAVNFRNEIIWHYGQRTDFHKGHFSRKHDIILFYARSNEAVLNRISLPWARDEFLKHRHDVKVDEQGREFIYADGGKTGVRYLRPVDEVLAEGKPLDTVWDLPLLNSSSKERLGYPTQKPEVLLERIIKAGSQKDDLVLDPFCGCGTSVSVAERLHRRWIGIDITYLAISLIKSRLHHTFKEELSTYVILGDPKTLSDARALAEQNRHQFEYWATGIIDASPPIHERKKGADRGIDGRIFFFDDKTGQAKTIIVQVKSGNVGPQHIRDLIGTLTSEKAVMGVFITLNEPTKPMKDAALSAGFYEGLGDKFPKLQILTVRELLAGKKPQYKALSEATFKRAKRTVKEPARSQQSLPFT